VKEPDFSFVPRGPDRLHRGFPSVVLESGWTSSGPTFVDDRRLWHEGSGGCVRVVIFVKLGEPNTEKKIRATLAISHCAPDTGTATIRTRCMVCLLSSAISRSQTLFY